MIRHVPVQFIQQAITLKKMRLCRTFLLLKHASKDGKLIMNGKLEVDIIGFLGVSQKTLGRHIQHLVHLNWIGKDNHGNIYLRSWSTLESISGMFFKARVEFHVKYLKKECFTGYFFGAVVGYQCRLKIAKKWKERKNGRSYQFQNTLSPHSIRYLSSLLGISMNSVHKHIALAVKYDFIYRQQHIEKTKIKARGLNLALLRKEWTENSFLMVKDGFIAKRHSDLFCPKLHFSRFSKRV